MTNKDLYGRGTRRLRRMATPLTGLALLAALVAGGGAPAQAAPATPSPGGPVVVAPSSPKPAPRPPTRTGDVPKPGTTLSATPDTTAYTLTLSAYPTAVLAGNATTLTATTNHDVGPTPYWIQIYDTGTGQRLVACGSGTTCTTMATSAPPIPPFPSRTRTFRAFVSHFATTLSAVRGVQSGPADRSVSWANPTVDLTAGATTAPTGTAVTLHAHTSFDVGPTPYWTEIFEISGNETTSTGTRIAACGGGQDCSATVTYTAPAVHRYVAYISANSLAYPPAGNLAVSVNTEPWVTWTSATVPGTPNIWQVSLASSGLYAVTATANGNVGPTRWYIEIFAETRDPDTGLDTGISRLASCAFGTTCTAGTVSPNTTVTAFLSLNTTSVPPAGTVANSNSITFRFLPA